MARSSEIKTLKTDVEKANERLETRKVVEKAKGYLMETNHVTEEEAYEYIRKMSKIKNVSMKRIAEIILMKCGR
jgi:two-component system, response regulator PdtaR